jgi:hypothetical protein
MRCLGQSRMMARSTSLCGATESLQDVRDPLASLVDWYASLPAGVAA